MNLEAKNGGEEVAIFPNFQGQATTQEETKLKNTVKLMYTIKKMGNPLLNAPSGQGIGTDFFLFLILFFSHSKSEKNPGHFNAFLVVQIKMPSILEHSQQAANNHTFSNMYFKV